MQNVKASVVAHVKVDAADIPSLVPGLMQQLEGVEHRLPNAPPVHQAKAAVENVPGEPLTMPHKRESQERHIRARHGCLMV